VVPADPDSLERHHVEIIRAMDSALIGHVIAEAKKAAERRKG
jgi:hypothetical protein